MKLFTAVFYFIFLPTLAIAASISFTNLNDPQSKQLFGQLVSEQWPNPTDEADATAAAMSSLLAYMAPNIKNIPGYTGYFAGNCSVFFNNVSIHQVGCNIIPVTVVSVNETAQVNPATRLPEKYATQITQSHILLANLFADWSRKVARKFEQFEVSLFQKVETCTQSVSPTETNRLTPSQTQIDTPTQSVSGEKTLTATQNISNTPVDSLSETFSISDSLTASLSESDMASISKSKTTLMSQTGSVTQSSSISKSQTVYPICAMNVYADSASQAARYLVTGDSPNATVTDLWTGLIWEQSVANSSMTWTSAGSYCSSLSKGGYSDWRLPSITELQSLVDYTVGSPGPAIDATIFPNTPSSPAWTSTANAGVEGYYWANEFAYGQINFDSQNIPKNVRCVRGNSLTVSSRYTDENGDVLTNQSTQVRDVLTGLTWERTPPTSYVGWGAAQAYCQSLTLGAATWRLPTIKELTSLIDYDSYSPAINQTAFPTPTSNFFWASTPCLGASGNGWIASFAYHGLVDYDNTAGDTNHAHCVRDAVWASQAYADATNQPDRYVIAGNGTDAAVRDTYTGLMWEQTGPLSGMTWSNATSYCAGLVKNNYGCWRLPTSRELQSLMDYKVSSPVINGIAFPNASTEKSWTSVLVAEDPNNAWFGTFDNGYVFRNNIVTSNFVRCVRGETTSMGKEIYLDSSGRELVSNSTMVRDLTTGLMWQRRIASAVMPWNAAAATGSVQAYCQNLVVGRFGAGSWRLPMVKELATLVNYTAAFPPGPMISAVVFVGAASNSVLWSATSSVGNPGYPLSVHCDDGDVGSNNAVIDSLGVRCVYRTDGSLSSKWSPIAYEDATNQTARYYVSGTSPNAIVTDDFTGLMWEQQISGSTYIWNTSVPAGSAQAYCASLTKGGYTDWRLPGMVELQSLVDYTLLNPSTNETSFPNTPFGGGPTILFGASASYAPDITQSWYISFAVGGLAHRTPNIIDSKFRCIRSGRNYPETPYTDENGNALISNSSQVKDALTGLIWQRIPSSGKLTLNQTQQYCQNLVIENQGVGSWRLPTVKELATLGNYTVNNPTINDAVFSMPPDRFFWTSTLFPGDSTIAWGIEFASDGLISTSNGLGAPIEGYVRCILNTSAPTNNGMWSPIAYQDATNQPARYSVSGSAPNAIVTDDFTGLMWEQQVSGSTYVWNASAPAGSAQAYCENLTKGGYTDWRLPTPQELQSLVSYGRPGIDLITFPSAANGHYWTSLPSATNTNYAWPIRFNEIGIVIADLKSRFNYVRCVRGLERQPVYTDEDGQLLNPQSVLVKDQTTGLIWQRASSSIAVPSNFTDAAGSAPWYCKNLVIGVCGAGSWRLPTVKELTSLVDYRVVPFIINTSAFPTPSNTFWSASIATPDVNSAWSVGSDDGVVNYSNNNMFGTAYVRCILNTSAPTNNGMWSPLAYADATNQTARYYVSGSAPNAIVTDDFTGLMWEQQVSPTSYTWNALALAGSAQAYCAGLNKGDYMDWRLPTVMELQSLVDYTIAFPDPTINTVFFSGPYNTNFWTSLAYVANSDHTAWDMFNTGDFSYYAEHDNVRCVRGNNMTTVVRYTDENGNASLNGGSTQVKDQATGLIWQRNQALRSYSWNPAQTYCNTLTLGNVTWRLPTAKELITIEDYTVYNPSINVTAFPSTAADCFWSSTMNASSTNSAHYINFFLGYSGTDFTTTFCCVRCVRP